ncbi:T9SS type A sorting domain-containing protein [uncultured Chryseobacterium sp.]|uniref:T9SS type A sorting domain-containing protein n=1 Tax=uncultured Chryseobacterium sp. TaxID=259322 RepID=UPI0025E8AA6C|nr:T9SS type A sorting domain-containing protein [uncultured Chryseobacterium sp.]
MIRKITMFIAATIAGTFFSQTFSNGNYTTGNISHSGVNSASLNGLPWSECQSDTGNISETNGVAGFACFKNPLESYFLADDFTVPVGETWNISQLNVFAYFNNYGQTTPSVMRVAILNVEDPFAIPVFGDFTTNRFSGVSNPVANRIFNSSVPASGNNVNLNRPVQKISATIGTALPAGHYWVFWQLQAQETFTHLLNDQLNLYCPPITVSSTRTMANWNAKQYMMPIGSVRNAVDGGYPSSVADVPQDFPFELVYSSNLATREVQTYDNSFRVFPNPVSETLTILWPFSSTIDEGIITESSGKRIRNVAAGSKSIDVSDLTPGVYFLTLKDNARSQSVKFIKK